MQRKTDISRPDPIIFIANFYLSQISTDWLVALRQYCDGMEIEFGLKFNEAVASYHEINKPLKRISAKNIQSLFNKIDENGIDNLSSIYFDLNQKEYKYETLEFQYSSRKDTYQPYYHIYILIRLDVFKKSGNNFKELFLRMIDQVKQIGKIEYAFLQTMHSEKMPLGYFCGFGSDIMTSDESNKLQIWKQNKQKYNELVWDVFLCNVLNRRILNEDIINKIKTIVGKDYITVAEDLFVFFLPVALDEWIAQYEQVLIIKDKLINLFMANSLIMEQVIKPIPAKSADKKTELPITLEVGKSVNYKGPTYVEKYLTKGSKKIIEKIEEEYCMAISGIGRKVNKKFNLLIDEKERYVIAKDSEDTIVIYDPSNHPANMAFEQKLKPNLIEYKCKKCGCNIFDIAVGYEYPDDAEDQNDISSFALAGKCAKCKNIKFIFEDETA